MDPTRISTQVSVKHCSLCQEDTEYYCYKCQQDLCIQCRKLHVVDLSTKHHTVTSYTEKMKYPRVKSSQSGDPKQVISARSQDPDNHEPCVMPFTGHKPKKFQPPVWLSPLERSEIQRRQYSDRIYQLRGETIYYRSVLLEGLKHDRDTGHKAVTIRGQSKAEMRGQGLKDLIDEVLAGDLEDRCIIQKTRMTRHMTKLLRYYHRFEQLSETMESRPIKFLRIMTRKHSPRKDTMKTIIKMLVNLMKEIRLVPSGIPRRAGVEDLLTLLSSPVVQKSLSVTGVKKCNHISCVTPDRVWVSDWDNLILTDTATGKQLHSVEDSLDLGSGIHTVNSEGELIYIDKEHNIIKLCNDMKTTTTLIKHTDTTWEPWCVYCSPSSGDLLVGMCRRDTNTGKVMRYDNTGKYKQTKPHDDNTPHTLYVLPIYITENNNGDVLVSDWSRAAVVVTSGEGVHRFSYTGPPSGSRLQPVGICTDVMSHILVIDDNTDTVQMLDRDGQFLSYVLTRQTPGMDYTPWSLSYDVTTNAVWVGSDDNNTMSVCQYINRHLHLTGNEAQIKDVQEQQCESDAAQSSAGQMNQQLGVGPALSAPPPAVSMPGPHQGLGMVVTEEYVIPDTMFGLRRNDDMPLSYYLDMFTDGGDMPDRQYTLTGSSGYVAACEPQIQGDITRANQTGFMGGMGGGSGGGQTVVEVMVPGNKVGLVIGKGGETIRQLQRRGGVKMVIIQDDNIPSAHEKPLRISGDPHKCQRAKEMVLELLAEREMKIPVPRTAAGMVIGKNGVTIKRIQQESGAKVQFKADDGHSPERVCAITGSPDKVQKAAQMIQHLLIEYNQREGGTGRGLGRGRGGGGTVRGRGEFGGGPGRGLGRGDGFRSSQGETQFAVPADKCGLVIGKGGETIRRINQESGAHVELQKHPGPNPELKLFSITGTPDQIQHAIQMIREKVGSTFRGAGGSGMGGPGGPDPHGGPVPRGPGQYGGQYGVSSQQQGGAQHGNGRQGGWGGYTQQ
uniref:Uncharacterized protein LOC111100403 isoform X4 n=1 Tax=Crassostrea virginica TaxID=6565 RepID=A0A8B8A9U9_CRAVI|nr:uncharacterized protein LOC111100403 isoform X4 [Crassostrea virginica]